MRATAPRTSRPPTHPLASLLILGAIAGCGGGAGTASPGGPAPAVASRAEWQALATPRPQALDGAARVSLGSVRILGSPSWADGAPVDASVGIYELVAAGLLRRRDVRYVDRRRFAPAAEAERRGATRPAGAPAAGVSVSPDYTVDVTWSSVGLDSAYVDVRLTDGESGTTVKGTRVATTNDADPASLARATVSALLAALRDVGHLPSWTDPVPAAAPRAFTPSGIPAAAARAFFEGIAAEDGWHWERARRAYQTALARGGDGFVEAGAALARAARLHNGGTLGEG